MAHTSSIPDRRPVLVALSATAAVVFVAGMLAGTGALPAAAALSILTVPAVYFFALRPVETHAASAETRTSPIEADITDQPRSEEPPPDVGPPDTQQRAQRLESIGLLAGGIAHDLNNVLSPIMMAVDLLKLTATDDQHALLETVSANTQRGAEMVRGVLSFARGLEGRRVDIQLRHLVREVEGIARETFPKNIQVRVSTTRDLWSVAGDPTQLHQVLLNLCINARDAMPAGGEISITARNVTFDERDAGMHIDAKPGRYVVIQVNDVGTGIPQSIIDKIFDPFFTTKEIGKGTGLGLSTSRSIVKGHGGFVRVASAPGSGAQFQVFLPALPEGFNAEAEAARPELPRGAGEMVLMVDDEAAVREITRQTLEAFGYRVLLAAHGGEAVALYTKHAGEIAVVVTDLLMPVMDGAATIRALKKLDPDVRVIAVSGSNDNGSIGTLPHISTGVIPLLSKPYTPETLLQALRQVIVREQVAQR
jgi:two-component system cell cycle sensor histidine kinase/response regulator CckA